MSAPRVLVVGGGAGGALSAVHLLREAGAAAVEILLVDRAGSFGPGVAYDTGDPQHLLNVPACRMGGIAGEPEHFHEWQRDRFGAPAAAFLPRGLYGEYLRDLLAAEEARADSSHLTRIAGEVVSLRDRGPGEGLQARLRDGSAIAADAAVLALGPPPAADPIPVAAELLEDGTYVREPWAAGGLAAVRGGGAVLIVGTGLTMVDTAITLGRLEPAPSLRAVSRHGLLPRRHRRELTRLEPFPLPLESGELEPLALAMQERTAVVMSRGGDWRDVFDSMRLDTPAIWRRLKTEQKRRFLLTFQRYWDVHRFRMAPEVADSLEALRADGRLRVQAGAILEIEPRRGGARVALRAQEEDGVERFDVDRVVNCTGAGGDPAANPLAAELIGSGLARVDELGLGLDVDREGRLVGADGRPSERIQVVGALRKGVEWEAIGVTEIREHAAVAARRLLAQRQLEVAA